MRGGFLRVRFLRRLFHFGLRVGDSNIASFSFVDAV